MVTDPSARAGATMGWWWADLAAALVVAVAAANEARENRAGAAEIDEGE
jgi:hypothetical protein